MLGSRSKNEEAMSDPYVVAAHGDRNPCDGMFGSVLEQAIPLAAAVKGGPRQVHDGVAHAREVADTHCNTASEGSVDLEPHVADASRGDRGPIVVQDCNVCGEALLTGWPQWGHSFVSIAQFTMQGHSASSTSLLGMSTSLPVAMQTLPCPFCRRSFATDEDAPTACDALMDGEQRLL